MKAITDLNWPVYRCGISAMGAQALAAGNIGTALSEVALMPAPPAWVALEVSSFQLHDTDSLTPRVGVLTNLAPDHLDRYESLEDYYADKDRLFLNAGPGSVWVTNGDDVEVQRRTARLRGAHRRFSVHGLPVDATSRFRSFNDGWNIIGIAIDRNATFQHSERDSFRLQIPFIDAHQGGELSARRVSHDIDSLRIASVLSDMLVDPAQRFGNITEDCFHFDVRQKSVVG